jgi:hypothetical protein
MHFHPSRRPCTHTYHTRKHCKNHPQKSTHTIILLGDFNRDIKLIGRHNTTHGTHPPTKTINGQNLQTHYNSYISLQIPHSLDKEEKTTQQLA